MTILIKLSIWNNNLRRKMNERWTHSNISSHGLYGYEEGDGEYINNGQTYLYHGDLNYMVTADHFNLSLIMC